MNLEQLTGLLAAQGVYALVIIFMFYGVNRAYKQYKEAPAEDRDYFKKRLRGNQIAAYVTSAVAAVFWMYVNLTVVAGCLEGYVTNLTDYRVGPSAPGARDRIVQEIHPVDSVAHFGSRRDDHNPMTGNHTLQWLLSPDEGQRTMEFVFTHDYQGWQRVVAGTVMPAPPSGTNCGRRVGDMQLICPDAISERFELPLDALDPQKRVQLDYQPNEEDPGRLGKLVVKQDDRTITTFDWTTRVDDHDGAADGIADAAPQATSWFGVTAAYADAQKFQLFGPDGSYDPSTGEMLRYQITSQSSYDRAQASELLVASGESAFRFIRDSLDSSLAVKGGYDYARLVHGLATAIEEMHERGVVVPVDLELEIASARFGIGDYPGAARHFGHTDHLSLQDNHTRLWQRAYTYQMMGDSERMLRHDPESAGFFARSVRDYKTYTASSGPGADVAYNNLSAVQYRVGNVEAAEMAARAAIAAAPNSYDSPYNNLAYFLVEQDKDIDEALGFIDKAIELFEERYPGQENPNFLDTRGWILVKLGHCADAVPVLERADELKPNDPEIVDHLRVAREGCAP